MSRRVLIPWFLLASLLFGLWAAAAHDPADHAGAAAHADVCAVCAFAGGMAGALPAAVAVLLLAGVFPPVPARACARPGVAPRSRVRVRGPPSFLA